MATLVLTAVGAVVAGPIGAAVGAIAGQQIDSRLFAPRARQGPRLGELAVQTSSYGSAIPKIFGTMRVAGTVIWATELQEQRNRSGGGKGRPATVSYTYSASFAVALSGRPIRAVRRIWADGKLLRGAAGDFKSETGFRLHHGGEDQVPDPLIAAAEGSGQAPAYRGIAYAMFEDFQLADYGNRIPSLTFEVEAEAGPVAVGAVAEELSGGDVAAGTTPVLHGYAASGDSVRGALETVGELMSLSILEEEGRLRLTADGGPILLLAAGEMGAAGDERGSGRTRTARKAAGLLPGEVSIAYYDPARDYQTGLQRATLGASLGTSERRAVPAALSAEAAKGLAEHRLATLWAGRATAEIHLPWRRSGIKPGERLRLPGESGIWKVARRTLERMAASLELVRVQSAGLTPAEGASPGRQAEQPDMLHGPTVIRLLDLPLALEPAPERPQLLAAAAGPQPGWRRAELAVSLDGGGSWEPAGRTAAPAVMGHALTILPAAGSALIDTRHTVDVELLNDAMVLESRNDAALMGGANLALLGNELIQFGVAEPLGSRRYRLSRLLRGRRGTEWAAAHATGEEFLLIEEGSLTAVPLPQSMIGGEVRLVATGIGDGDAAADTCVFTAEALRPPSPVHFRAVRLPNGDVSLNWVRRSRAGWTWLSGSDTPLAEESELYRLTLSGADFERSVQIASPAYLYTAAQQAEDGLAGPLTATIVQLGTHAASRPATFVLS